MKKVVFGFIILNLVLVSYIYSHSFNSEIIINYISSFNILENHDESEKEVSSNTTRHQSKQNSQSTTKKLFENNKKEISNEESNIKELESNNNEDNKNEDEQINKIIIDIKSTIESSDDYKFGVKITKKRELKEYTYMDGTKDIKENIYYIYDKSNYYATTKELKNEAKELIDENISNRILSYVNELRIELALNNLKLDYNLSLSATIRALELAYSDILSHTRPNEKKWNNLLDELSIKYDYAGENIGWYYNDAKSIFKAWKESEGHYNNMINKNYNKIGVGMVNLNGTKYWVQLFTN